MAKNKPGSAPHNLQAELACEEEKEAKDALHREMLLLTQKVGRNPLARGYYTQIKAVLEDLLMLELAQKAAEATMKFQTRDKILVVNDKALAPFRAEMERAKTLKLVSGVLSLSGHLDVDGAVELAMSALYGPRDKDKPAEKEGKLLTQLQAMLDGYAKKIEATIVAQAKRSPKGGHHD